MRVEIAVGGTVRDVAVTPVPSRPGRFRVAWDDVTHEVDARIVGRDQAGVRLSLVAVGSAPTSREIRCSAVDRIGAMTVEVGGVVVEAVVNGRRRRAAGARESGAASGAFRLIAPMPGKVVRVLVAPGDTVAARQPLVVVEAMKMENELTAARAGTVTEIPVAEGMSVETGRLLAVIE